VIILAALKKRTRPTWVVRRLFWDNRMKEKVEYLTSLRKGEEWLVGSGNSLLGF